jgi:ribosome-binding factor A
MPLEQKSSERQNRYGEVIRSLISECLLRVDFFDNEIPITSITVSFVKMSKDLRVANVYFMPLGGKFKNKLLETLNSKKYLFQKHLATAKLQSKFTPKINFYIDDTFDEAEKISRLLLNKKVLRDLKNE